MNGFLLNATLEYETLYLQIRSLKKLLSLVMFSYKLLEDADVINGAPLHLVKNYFLYLLY
jgi:hypothetical protein